MDVDNDTTEGALPTNCKIERPERHACEQQCKSEKLDGPPDGFLFVLPFLDLQSRLTMERVSKPLREAVRDNPLVWQNLNIEQPASRKLTDDILLTLVKRADGHVKSLRVVESLRITDAAVEQVLALNPGLEKLSIPGCTELSVETIVRLVESHSLEGRAKGFPGIKQVQIRGLYNITKEQLDRLQEFLQPVGYHPHSPIKVSTPRYYGNVAEGLQRHDARPIDVGLCPICANVRVIYDCTRHWIAYDSDLPCQGCTFCIPRCEECGCCIRDLSYDQSLCSDLVCTDCWFLLPKCSECNRAVCGRHAHQFIQGAGTAFTCEECHALADGPEFSFAGEI